MPQAGHTMRRSLSASRSSLWPQQDISLLDANQRSANTRCVPYLFALYSICRRNSPSLMSESERARRSFLSRPPTLRSSRPIAWFSRHSLVVALCRKSCLILATRACRRASRAALSIWPEDRAGCGLVFRRSGPMKSRLNAARPGLAISTFRERRRDRIRKRRSAAFNGFGPRTFPPSKV